MEIYNYGTDINQLLYIIVNAFYSNKEVFLRELISNASDALEKYRYEKMTNNEFLDLENMQIKIYYDKNNEKLYIEDNGIGMTKNDIVNNLGTIASSGTKKFIDLLKNKNNNDVQQIGQFGVGFYSSFLVANKVNVYTKHDNDDSYLWSSELDDKNQQSCYSITKLEEKLSRGTKIELFMKKSELGFLEDNKIESIVKKHSQFILYPILLEKNITKKINVPENKIIEENNEENNNDEEIKEENNNDVEIKEEKNNDEEIKEEKNNDEEKKQTTVIEKQWIKLNPDKPIWRKNKDEVTEEEYKSFYKTLSNKVDDPLFYKHIKIEGNLEYESLIFIPQEPELNFLQNNTKTKNLKLYIKRIFVMDDSEYLLPEWLRFVYGIVDSDSLPLSISRETIQESNILTNIKKNLTSKIIDMFIEFQTNDKYIKFYNTYSKFIKLGIHNDSKNKDKLMKLLRFSHLEDKENLISLDDYVKNMKEGQKNIYYLTGTNKETLLNSPYLEAIKNKNYNVLIMYEPIDEFISNAFNNYGETKFVSLVKEGVNLTSEEEIKKLEEENKTFIAFIKETLKDEIENVKISTLLNESPCIITTTHYSYSANLEKLLKAQAIRETNMDAYMKSKKILEINLNHDLIIKLKNSYECNIDKSKLYLLNLYNCALLEGGFEVENPKKITSNFIKLLNEQTL